MYTVTFDHGIKDSQGKKIKPEVFYGSGSSSDSERQKDVISRGESCEDISGSKSISASTRRSSSSSLSNSSAEPDAFFGIDALNFATSNTSTLVSGQSYVSSTESSAKSETDNSPRLPPLRDQLYNLSYNQKGMSPTASPPMQVMDRSGGFSSRIPSSVFERNTNASEWSVASNDSLFSIHLEQNSFHRENPFLVGELVIPEELTKSGELNLFNQTPPVIVEEIDAARIKDDTENLQTTGTSDETFKSERNPSKGGNEIKTSHQTAIYKSSKSDLSEFSNGSESSVHSFVQLKKRSRSSCCCSDHSWECCKWPSCKCSSCDWALYSCWNCSHTNCCSSPVNSSTKTRQQSFKLKQESETSSDASACCCNCFQSKQASDSEVTSKPCTDCCDWFHCFSCSSCSWKTSCGWKLSCTRCKGFC